MSEKPLILALETSSRIGSVALAEGPALLAETRFSGAMKHSAELFPAISHLLDRFARRPEDIRHLYISIGPGSFTGLRIAVAVAKSMHLAGKLSTVAVDSLDVIAANVTHPAPESSTRASDPQNKDAYPERIAPILDAKRGQFYVAIYQKRKPKNANSVEKPSGWCAHYQKVRTDSLLSTAQILEMFANSEKPLHLLGDGLLYHRQQFEHEGIRILDASLWSPRAANVHALGWPLALEGRFADPLTLTPLYIRRPEAEEKWQQRNRSAR